MRLRDAAGHGNSLARLSGGLTGYRNTEEFIAVLVVNIYMTDPSNRWATGVKVGLRASHRGHGKAGPDLSDSLEFFAGSHDTFRLIEQFCREDAWFTKQLAETRAAFNPIMVYYDFQTAAAQIGLCFGGRSRYVAPPGTVDQVS